jgi:hypothetical protein
MMMAAPLEGRRLHIIYSNAEKRPLGLHGWNSAVADAQSIARLRPGLYVGVATGIINGIVVVDVDPRHGGDKTLTEHLSWLPPTRTHRSKSGGQHLIYRYPPQGIRNFTGTDKNGLPGIELKSDGYGVVWPPSPGYSVLDDRPMADCPDRLCELAAPPQLKNNASHASLLTGQTPKPIYDTICSLIPLPFNQRRVTGALRELLRTTQGRNKVCYNTALLFRKELIRGGVIAVLDAADLLLAAMQANGYWLKPNGKYRAESTIRSGLGLRWEQWPQNPTNREALDALFFNFSQEEDSS